MSTNISKQHREELLDKIRQIRIYIAAAPQDSNTGNLLQYLEELTKDVKGKKYGLVFEQHREEIDEKLETHTPVLSEQKELFIDNGGEMNFLIEGDNLAALQLLEKTHKGKIDVIYIDPPYNTGNKDFVYDDNFVGNDDMFRHSKWLSFMEKRLKVAQQLLSHKGVIFISIDDNEQSNLKMLCDEVFGEKNFVAMITNVTGAHQSGAGVLIQKNIEYCFVYAHSIEMAQINRVDQTEETYRNLNDAPTPLSTRLEMGYSIYYEPVTKDMIALFDYDKDRVQLNTVESVYKDDVELIKKGYVPVRPGYRNGKLHRWRWGIDTFNERKGEIVMFSTKRGLVPKFKQCGFNAPKNIIEYSGGAIDLKKIFGEDNPFDYPKSASFIQYLCNISTSKDSTVLDFFAGSGTTGHAVMKLNAEDGGRRKFILCTNNESNICRDVTYERLRTVITGKRKDGSEYNEKHNASLKYFKIDFIPISDKLYYEYADQLLLHIRELVELENGINFNGNDEIAIVLTDEEMEQFVAQEDNKAKVLYRGHDVLLTGEQEEYLRTNGIKVNVIPDYYYNELNK